MIPRWKQQLGGLFIALIGAGFMGWTWYTALYQGYFYFKASLIFPPFFVIGLGLILFPGYKEERLARGEDISRMEGSELITLRWWIILALGFVAAGVNYLLLSMIK
jgi:ABC-type Fe3+-siderophore transport system permease subunit